MECFSNKQNEVKQYKYKRNITVNMNEKYKRIFSSFLLGKKKHESVSINIKRRISSETKKYKPNINCKIIVKV